MSDEVASTLTVAKLKALCILNDLATSGKKSDLVKRLLESGLEPNEVGLPSESKAEPAQKPQEDEEEIVLSMEDEDTLTPDVEPEPEDEVDDRPAKDGDDDVSVVCPFPQGRQRRELDRVDHPLLRGAGSEPRRLHVQRALGVAAGDHVDGLPHRSGALPEPYPADVGPDGGGSLVSP